MALPIFALTHQDVHDRYFPSLANFSSSTKPTSTVVGKFIDAEASRLQGALIAMNTSAVTISADVGATYPSAYAWCQDAILQGAAIRVMQAISGAGAVPTYWREELEGRYDQLATLGPTALGDASLPSDEVNGPRSHISVHTLDTGDTDLISDVVPKFRRSDLL